MADNATILYESLSKAIADVTKSAKSLEEQEKNNLAVKKELISQQKELLKTLSKTGGAKEFAQAQKQVENNIKAAALAEKESIKIQQQAEKLKREKIRTEQLQIKSTKQIEQATVRLNSLYKQESARLTELRNKAKDVALQFGLNSKQFKAVQTDVLNLDSKLKGVDASLGQHQRIVGNYQKALGGLKTVLGAAGIVVGVQLFTNAIKEGLRIQKEYEKANAVLAGVLGKTRKETEKLQSESKRLGSTTAFSASQVTELQTELARLGKTEPEIIAMTEGIIDATIALGSETGETAALIGSTLNAFNLNASESSKVADILTLSTQKSALSFEKLNVALPTVSGAAAAVGASLEDVVAQLGQAADRGIDASTAATSLRNIYIKLADKGISYSDAMEQINNSQNKLTTAVELFDTRASVTALALAENKQKADELSRALKNAGGTAKIVADEQLNTLDGQLKLLSSAWEGLMLSFSKTESLSSAIKLITKLIELSTPQNINTDLVSGIIGEEEQQRRIIEARINVQELEKQIISLQDQLSEQKNIGELGKIIAPGTEESLNKLNQELNEANEILKETESGKIFITELTIKLKEQEQAVRNLTNSLGENSDPTINQEIERRLIIITGLQQQINTLNIELENYNKLQEINGNNELINKETDLIKIQEELLEKAKELPRTTETEIAYRNIKIKKIEEEIDRLKALYKEQELLKSNSLDLDQLTVESKTNVLSTQKQIDAELEKSVNDRFEKAKILAQNETEFLKNEYQKRKELQQALYDAGFESAQIISDQLFQNAQIRRDEETQAEIDAMNSRLENENLDAEQREAIQKQINEKEKKLKTDKAKADKKAAITQAIINTALSISKTAATLGFPAAIPFIAFAAITGLAQQIAIASQPLPKFDKGIGSAPSTGFIAGEKRPEFMIHNGQVSLVDKPTLFGSDYKGAEIIGGAQSAKIIDRIKHDQLIESLQLNSNYEKQMFELAFDKAMENHTSKIVKELRMNRPYKPNYNDSRADNSYNKYRN